MFAVFGVPLLSEQRKLLQQAMETPVLLILTDIACQSRPDVEVKDYTGNLRNLLVFVYCLNFFMKLIEVEMCTRSAYIASYSTRK